MAMELIPGPNPVFGSLTAGTINGAIIDNLAWTAYTPTVTAGSGTFTTVAGSGRYKQIGKTVFLNVVVTITTNGSAATDVIATFPVPLSSNAAFTGRATQVSGKQLQGTAISGTQLAILNYDNSYPGATGETLIVSGTYEAA